jgi:hypothetical protein
MSLDKKVTQVRVEMSSRRHPLSITATPQGLVLRELHSRAPEIVAPWLSVASWMTNPKPKDPVGIALDVLGEDLRTLGACSTLRADPEAIQRALAQLRLTKSLLRKALELSGSMGGVLTDPMP